MSETKKEGLSRRSFLISAGAVAAGALTVGGVFGALAPRKAEALSTAPAPPWPYTPLDTEVVRKKGYQYYWSGGCCYGAARALVEALFEALPGSAWETLPLDMFRYGAGGIYSWGTVCGALNGAIPVISMIVGPANGAKVSSPLIGWYQETPFPSTKLDGLVTSAGGKQYTNVAQTISDSPLCHTSVSKWCTLTDFGVNSDQKKDRCAKLTGDVAAKAVEWLNAWYNSGKTAYPTAYKYPESQVSCMTCHVGTTAPSRDNVQGTMNCIECHDDAEYQGGHHGF